MVAILEITPEMCECGRLYKDRRDEKGKTMCSACYCDCDIETLKKLWGNPKKGIINSEFGSSIPISFITSKGIKRMEVEKNYDENLNEI